MEEKQKAAVENKGLNSASVIAFVTHYDDQEVGPWAALTYADAGQVLVAGTSYVLTLDPAAGVDDLARWTVTTAPAPIDGAR